MTEPDRDRLLDLIVKWDELRDDGKTATAEEVCPDDPELQAALRQKIAERLKIERLIATPSTSKSEIKINISSSKTLVVPATLREKGVPHEPERIGRYRVERRLGAGGFGQVFLAYDDELSRYVAVKIPHRELLVHSNAVETYRREARSVASLDHPNIVPVYDVGTNEQYPCFIVSKYIAGTNLYVRMSQSKLSLSEAVSIVVKIADALNYTHALGVVHRDIKPVNILLSTSGEPFVVDFGLALNERDGQDGRRFAGTPAYMSPEQARGEAHRVDGRTDIFSLGVVFYELLTQQKPLRGSSDTETLRQIISVEPKPPTQIDETIPKELERICLKAMSKRTGDRYRTAHDFAEDLRYYTKNLLTPTGASASTPVLFGKNPLTQVGQTHSSSQSASGASSIKIVPKGLRSYDAHDTDFFLELLPGPRDREGLPDSIRFWKSRIEVADSDEAFPVGLIYGPSGCGKSSLVKAGLLPRLDSHVITLYLEATADDTETKLLQGLRKRCPGLPDNLSLTQTIARLRQGSDVPTGKKVLIVLDQFEQWLHSRKETPNTELVDALRQCDGSRVQCIVMVRDDFWLAVSRFLKELEVRLIEGQNSALVDLFDLDHAKKVLEGFGRAFGKLPESSAQLTKEQREFLSQSANGLAEEGRVISVRLSLFAEMMKGKTWRPATVKSMGGIHGVGETFLEETFSVRTAPPEHRHHQHAIINVLKSLLPEFGTEIKGNMRSYDELLQASGYSSRPQDFAQVLRILDGELRLITPTDSPEVDGDQAEFPKPTGEKFYQLTHDYLVHSLRNWLIRKQKETRRGQAELRMSDWSSIWNAKPENRNLPGPFEWTRMRTITERRAWTEPQRKMMQAAQRYYILRGSILGLILAVASITGFTIQNQIAEREQLNDARGLVRAVTNAEIDRVPEIIDSMATSRHWVDPLLREAQTNTALNPLERLNVDLALLRVDPTLADNVYERLLQAIPYEVPVVVSELTPYKDRLVPRLWDVASSSAKGDAGPRLRAVSALAQFDPDGERWTMFGPVLADQLVQENPLFSRIWNESLRPVKSKLLSPLAEIYRDRSRPEIERTMATNFLTDYADGQPELLAELLMDADEKQFATIFPKFSEQSEHGTPILEKVIERSVLEAPADEKEALAKHQANAAVALLRLKRPSKIWHLLKHSADPRARSYLIHRFVPLGADSAPLIERLETEPDITIRRALMLSLGEFDEEALPRDRRLALIPKLREIYRTDVDSGLRAAAEWLLRKWNNDVWLKQTMAEWVEHNGEMESRLEKIRTSLTAPERKSQHNWYVNSQGQTFIVVPGPIEFMMGSDEVDSSGIPKERRHTRRIDRSFAIMTTTVTLNQIRKHDPDFNEGLPAEWSRSPDLPAVGLSWFLAALYCNWLNEQEDIPPDQWCYSVKGQVLKMKKNFLSLSGYRFPTEAELEYVTRSGATTARYYGETEELLPHYAWYQDNSQQMFWPVGTKKPNDFGFFDTHGNVYTWCQGQFKLYPDDEIVEDDDNDLLPYNSTPRSIRGGAFIDRPSYVRSAFRVADLPVARNHSYGFRLVRTITSPSDATPEPSTELDN